jgi:RHS repeat-associated protein
MAPASKSAAPEEAKQKMLPWTVLNPMQKATTAPARIGKRKAKRNAARNAASPNAGYYYGGLTFGYNAAAQTQAATADIVDATHPAGILGAMTYTPLGAIATVELGSQYGQVFQYDQRGRTTIRYSINLAGDTVLGDQWGYDTVGNVTTANDSAQGDFSYQYDPLNRVTNASIPLFTETYSYDPWGNQTAHAVTEGSSYQWNYMPTTQNQASNPGVSYDASGNMTSDGIHNYTYDAESRTMGVTDQGVSYDYDPEGMRVATLTSGAVTAEYLYDLSSNLVTTVTNNGQLVRAILRANETHWGDYIGTGDAGASGVTTEFRLVNQVGTLVANGDTQGNFVEGCLSGPFGDGQICTPSYDYTETHFTDKLRDQESNNDYFGARYFGSTLGRFMSPDPSGLYYANPANPQSLNLYSYGQNNPLTNIDPTGKDCIHINNDTGNYEGTDIGDCDNSTEALANSGHYVDGTVASLSYNTGSGNYSFSYYSYDQSSNAVASNGIIAGAGQPITIPLSADVLNYAMNQTTPLSGPYQYGNYTGKGGMGIPRNNADAGALQHDYCYAQGGFSVGSNFGPHSAALQACNQSLCDTENSVRAGLHAKGLAMQGGQEVPGVGAEYSLTYSDFGEAAAAEDISDYFTLAPFHGNGCH